ncbi:MAG: hypothetical protein ACRBN8_19740 [Nannocystales bacterium]
MPLSTPAKVTIGVLAGVATITGVVAVARARDKDDEDTSKSKGAKPEGGGMRRDDGTRPANSERPVVELDMDALVQVTESEMGFPVSVGDRNEIPFPKDTIAEFAAGRRIETVVLGKVVAGEFTQSKTWSLVTPSFEVSHNDATAAFDAAAVRLSFTADRAGIYFLGLKDQDGAEIADGFLFSATSKAVAA